MLKTNYICAVAKEINDINTGDWKEYPVVIDQEKCIKCTMCVMYCPTNSVKRVGDEYRIKPDYCKGCGVCIHECKNNAIYIVKEDS